MSKALMRWGLAFGVALAARPAGAQKTGPGEPLAPAAAPASPAPAALPRVAIADISDLASDEGGARLDAEAIVKAGGQGVRDACLNPRNGRFREPRACERPMVNAPAGMCADLTRQQALAPGSACGEADLTIPVVELGSSACRTVECLRSDGKAAGATHVLIVQGRNAALGLEVSVELVDLSSDAVASRRYRDYFPVGERDDAATVLRTPPQILGIVRGLARDLVEMSLGGALTTRLSVTTPLSVPRPAAAPPRLSSWPREAWALIGGGVAISAAGGVLWFLDGRQEGCSGGDTCANVWDTRRVGIPLVVGGALALGAGLWLLFLPRRESQLMLVPNGQGLTMAGRF